jgi:hypothetical protein
MTASQEIGNASIASPQPIFDRPVLSPADAAEIAMRKDFPRE